MGSKSEVKGFEYILFHFTSVLYNILLVLGNPKPLFDFPSYKQITIFGCFSGSFQVDNHFCFFMTGFELNWLFNPDVLLLHVLDHKLDS